MTSLRAEKLIEKLDRGLTKTIQFFETLDHSKWSHRISNTDEAWTTKELVGHFITSEDYLLRIAVDIASGGEGAPKNIEIDKINHEDIRRFPHLPVGDLLNLLVETRRETISWVREIDDTTLDMIGHHPTLGPSNVETVVFSIYAHQLLHMRETVRNLKGK